MSLEFYIFPCFRRRIWLPHAQHISVYRESATGPENRNHIFAKKNSNIRALSNRHSGRSLVFCAILGRHVFDRIGPVEIVRAAAGGVNSNFTGPFLCRTEKEVRSAANFDSPFATENRIFTSTPSSAHGDIPFVRGRLQNQSGRWREL